MIIFTDKINIIFKMIPSNIIDGLFFVTLTTGDNTVKKTGSEALQSAGKSSKSKTLWRSKLIQYLNPNAFLQCMFSKLRNVMSSPQNDKPGLKKGFPARDLELEVKFAWSCIF